MSDTKSSPLCRVLVVLLVLAGAGGAYAFHHYQTSRVAALLDEADKLRAEADGLRKDVAQARESLSALRESARNLRDLIK